MPRIYWLLLFFIAGISSCCKKKLYCDADKLKIVITGYNRLDVRSIMVKKYKTGDFRKAEDSAIFIYSGTAPAVFNKKDTLYFSDYTTTSATLRDIKIGNDWDFIIPARQERHRIVKIGSSDHSFEMVKCGDNSTTCVNPIAYFELNGGFKYGNEAWVEYKKP